MYWKNKVKIKMKIQRFVCTIICAVMLVSNFNVYALDKNDTIDNYEKIYNIDDLIGINNNLSGNYILMNDIDLTEATSEGGNYDTGNGWVPINNFSGVLDGNGYRINGMHIYGKATQQYIGFFGSGFQGSIKNLGMSNVDISITSYDQPDYYDWLHVGALVGYADRDSIIDQCFVSGNITVSDNEDKANRACGLVGYGNETTILNCINMADVTCNFLACGLYFTTYPGTEVINSYNIGKIVGNGVSEDEEDQNPAMSYAIGNYAKYYNVYYLYGSAEAGAERQADSVKAITASQMKSEKSFTNWDFDKVWIIDSYSSYAYPQLRNAVYKKVKKIDILSLPNKMNYYVGDPIDYEGGRLSLTYEDDKIINTNMDAQSVSYKSITEGKVPMYLSYMGFDYGIAYEITENLKRDGSINISVDGSYIIYNDAKPFIDKNKRTLCPLRVVADALDLYVSWNATDKNACFFNEKAIVLFHIGSNQYWVNDANKSMDTAAIIKNSRTYAPVRYLAEAAGYKVNWNAATRTVEITS